MLNNLDHIKYDELIGKFVDVLSSDQSINGISGLVINETKNTIHVLHNNKTKIIPKSTCNFTFSGDVTFCLYPRDSAISYTYFLCLAFSNKFSRTALSM